MLLFVKLRRLCNIISLTFPCFTPYNHIIPEIHIGGIHMSIQKDKSYFDGGLLQLVGWQILGGLVTAITLGICFPWAICMIYRWEAKHTVINGHRLKFTGTAMQLFGNWIKWLLLTIITLGIYSFWLNIKLMQWKTKHTVFDD